jgi:hypothetical protein
MKKLLTLWTLALLTLAGIASADAAATFGELMKPYEEIRQALVLDSLDGVAEKAAAIGEKADQTADDENLLKISGFARQLSEASDLEGARGAFYELSKVMVRYRSKVGGEGLPVVAYCSMLKKSWLQPEGEIGNPYYGQSMAVCGEVVGE